MTNPPPGPGQIGPDEPTEWARPAVAPPVQPDKPTQHLPRPEPVAVPGAPEPDEGKPSRLRFLRDPLSAVLALVIVVALVLAGLLGAELYVRHRADTIVARAVSCVVQDQASVSFGVRPFLLQHFTHQYSNISVETAGNQIREAKGMKLNLLLDDIQLNKTADSAGTMGALDATITWSSDGIKQTVQDAIPFLGGLVSGVATRPSDGTIEIKGAVGTVTAKPQVSDGGLTLQVVELTGLGFSLPKETVQPALDAFTSTLTKNLPMGIHADSVQVTDTGVTAKFITRNATIPNGQQDPCFAGL